MTMPHTQFNFMLEEKQHSVKTIPGLWMKYLRYSRCQWCAASHPLPWPPPGSLGIPFHLHHRASRGVIIRAPPPQTILVAAGVPTTHTSGWGLCIPYCCANGKIYDAFALRQAVTFLVNFTFWKAGMFLSFKLADGWAVQRVSQLGNLAHGMLDLVIIMLDVSELHAIGVKAWRRQA